MFSDTRGFGRTNPYIAPTNPATNCHHATPSVGIHEIESFDLYWQVVILHVNKNLTGFEQEIEQELPLREFR
jgi:hypothetical protein